MTSFVMTARDRRACRWRLPLRDSFVSGAFDQFVEFTAIQPHAAAGRAIIDFNSLAVRHQQIRRLAHWTFHYLASFVKHPSEASM
jgi:hypothetical protein